MPLIELSPAVVEVVSTKGAFVVICPVAFKFKSLPDTMFAAPAVDTVSVLTYNVPIVYVPVERAVTDPVAPITPVDP
jgi:hypothetical protein